MAADPDALRRWHRLFGLILTDFFAGSPFAVEVERDLSVQQQFLDVLIIRRGEGDSAERLPDGLEDLRPHNLLTFKSHHESLNAWAVKELMAHSVAYRKHVSPTPSDLIAEDQFGLFAVAARFPQQLSEQVPLHRVSDGVYDCRWGTDPVRIVVAGRLPREPHNAPLHLFAAKPALIEFGATTYRPKTDNISGVLGQLFQGLQAEGFAMPFTMEDFRRQFMREQFPQLSPEETINVIQSLPEERRANVIQAIRPEERLAGLTDEQRLAGLTDEQRLAGLTVEQRIAGLNREQLQQMLDRLAADSPSQGEG